MQIIFLGKSEKDLKAWQEAGNIAVLKKIRKLLEAILQEPFEGIGKPEPLKHNLSGKWSRRMSRRITGEHRLVYAIEEDTVKVYSLKGHYFL